MDDRKLDRVIKRRGGVVLPSDAPDLGLSRPALSQHARRNLWEHPFRGVFIAPGTEIGFGQAAVIAVAAAGPSRVLLARRAASHMWGMTRGPVPDTIDLLAPADRKVGAVDDLTIVITEDGRQRPITVKVRRSRTLMRSHATQVADYWELPVTTVARTVIDLAAVLDVDDLRSLVIDSRQRRLVTMAEIRRLHDAISVYPGRGKVTRVVRDLDEDDCDSRLEWDFRKEARARGLRPYPKPFPFRCSDGVVIEIDVAFPQQWVACECDGLSSRADRASLAKHHLRQNRAVADGWRPFTVDWTRLKRDPERLFAELAALLASSDPSRTPAHPAPRERIDLRFRSRRR